MTEFIDSAIVSLATCNGALNRTESKPALMARAYKVIYANLSAYDIIMLDQWLEDLSPEGMDTLVDGEHSESQDIAALSPIGSNGDCVGLIFDKVFEVL